MEWNDGLASGWKESAVRRNDAPFTAADGLTVIIGADDNIERLRDHDYNDMLLRCKYFSREISPFQPFVNKLDFALPERRRRVRSGLNARRKK